MEVSAAIACGVLKKQRVAIVMIKIIADKDIFLITVPLHIIYIKS